MPITALLLPGIQHKRRRRFPDQPTLVCALSDGCVTYATDAWFGSPSALLHAAITMAYGRFAWLTRDRPSPASEVMAALDAAAQSIGLRIDDETRRFVLMPWTYRSPIGKDSRP